MSRAGWAKPVRPGDPRRPERAPSEKRTSGRPPWVRDGAVTLAVAGAVLLYCLRGGSYGLVARHELAITVWWVLALGVLIGVLPRRRPSRWALVGLAGLTALLAVTAASLLWTSASDRTELEIARVAHVLGVLLLVSLLAGRDNLRPMARGVLAGLAAVCALALASRLAPGSFPAQEALRTFETSRLSYPLNYWNALAALGGMTVTGLIGWSAHTRGLERGLALSAAPIAMTVVLLTYSRAGLASTAAGFGVLLLVSRHRWTAGAHAALVALGGAAAILTVREHPAIADATGAAGAGPVLLAVLAAAAACAAGASVTERAGLDRVGLPPRVMRIALCVLAVVALAGAVVAHGRVLDTWEEFKRPASYATQDPAERLTSLSGYRYSIYRSAASAFEDAPLNGLGAGTFDFWFNRHGGVPYLRDAHSLYLETAAELGLAGLAALVVFLGGLAAGIVVALRRSRDDLETRAPLVALTAISAVWVVHAGVDWLWESTAVTIVGVGCAALAAAPLAARSPRSPRLATRLAVLVLALAAIAVQLPALNSTSLERRSATAAETGALAEARRLADEAVAVRPWSASALTQRAVVDEQDGRLPVAAAYAREAVRREPENWEPWLVLARIEGERGRTRAAVRAYRTARRLRPASEFFQRQPGSQPG